MNLSKDRGVSYNDKQGSTYGDIISLGVTEEAKGKASYQIQSYSHWLAPKTTKVKVKYYQIHTLII